MTLYKLSKGGTSYEVNHPMQESRVGAKSIAVNGDMWITGGYNGKYFDSTEFITTQNFDPIQKINLPEPVWAHTIFKFNDTTSFLIGGETSNNLWSSKTHFYNHFSKTWIGGPDLLTGRNMHTSGLIQDHETHMQHIVVTGRPVHFCNFEIMLRNVFSVISTNWFQEL